MIKGQARAGGRLFRLTAVLALAMLALGSVAALPPADSATLGASPPPAQKPWQQGPHAVIIVVDAARYEEFNLAQMPNLARLVAAGTWYSQAWVGQLPSITETSHATIGTGVLPSRHLILGDTWRVPGTERMSPSLLDGNLDKTGYISTFIKQTHVPSLAGLVKAQYPGSVVVALSGHKLYAADALGAGLADYVAFGAKDSRGHYVPGAIPGHVPSQRIMSSPQLDLPGYPRQPGVEDAWTTTLAEKFLFKYHPRLMMINLPEVDVFGHAAGTQGSVMQPLIANVDRQIGRLVAAYGRAGLLGQTDFVVTADHAMIPALHTVDEGAIQKIVVRAGGQPLYIGHGDYSPIWLKNPAAVPRVAAALANARLANVAAVYMKGVGGRYVLVSAPTRLAVNAVQGSYADLLGTFDSAESPDIVLLYDENTITMTSLFAKIGRKGDHGGATWASQHIPLVLAGPGIRQGYQSQYQARLVDIAPTVETLLSIHPQGQDGVPLADAMTAPPGWAIAAQNAVAPRMSADVTALEQEAAARPNQK